MWGNNLCSLIIPTKNEGKNLSFILPEIPEFIDEIIIVDAGSQDNTITVAKQFDRVSKIVCQTAKGKGAALSRGFLEAKGDYVFIIDADGSMIPNELFSFAEALSNGFGVVKGSRNLSGGGSDDITLFRNLGNLGLTKIANLLFKQSWSDLAYGYAGFQKETLLALEISYLDTKISKNKLFRNMSYGQGFEIETLMFCRAIRRGASLIEIPSQERERHTGSSNLRAISDGSRALYAILLERIRSKRQI